MHHEMMDEGCPIILETERLFHSGIPKIAITRETKK